MFLAYIITRVWLIGGPFSLNDASLSSESYRKTGIPALISNPEAWSKKHNLLFIDYGNTGYSRCIDTKVFLTYLYVFLTLYIMTSALLYCYFLRIAAGTMQQFPTPIWFF